MITDLTSNSRTCLAVNDARMGRETIARSREAMAGRQAVLRDGSQILIRQIRESDTALVADVFAGLSARSRQFRFLMTKIKLTTKELRYLTDIDHHDHDALAALNPINGRCVGIARYVRDAEDPQAAEIAVTVVDDWQRRGVGSELFHALTDRARQEGIRRFTALVSADNIAVVRLLRKLHSDVELVGHESGILEYEITPARNELHAVLAALSMQ